MNHKTGISLRRIAPKFKVSFKTIANQLKAMGIHYHKKQRAPKYTEKKLQEIPTRARRLYRDLLKNDYLQKQRRQPSTLDCRRKYCKNHSDFTPYKTPKRLNSQKQRAVACTSTAALCASSK